MPTDPGARRAILDAVDGMRGEQAALLARLVRHRSLLGQEQSCLDEMEAVYRECGLAPRRVAVDADALASHPGFSPPLLRLRGARQRDRGASSGRAGAGPQPDAARACGRGAGGRRPSSGPARPSRPRSATDGCSAAARAT